jgi:hypothetical protein
MKAAIVLLLALAGPAHAALTATETARAVALITGQYAGLATEEIVLLLRLRVSPYITISTNHDGSVTYWYERREVGEIVELAVIVTVPPAGAAE